MKFISRAIKLSSLGIMLLSSSLSFSSEITPTTPAPAPTVSASSKYKLMPQIKEGVRAALDRAGMLADKSSETYNPNLLPANEALGFTEDDVKNGGTVLQRLEARESNVTEIDGLMQQTASHLEEEIVEKRRDVNLSVDICNTIQGLQQNILGLISAHGSLMLDYLDPDEHQQPGACYDALKTRAESFFEELRKETNPTFPAPYTEEQLKPWKAHHCLEGECINADKPVVDDTNVEEPDEVINTPEENPDLDNKDETEDKKDENEEPAGNEGENVGGDDLNADGDAQEPQEP